MTPGSFPYLRGFGFCISVSGLNIDELIEKANLARKYRPDLIELRLDLLQKIDPLVFEGIRNLIRGKEILTLRSSREGGHYNGPESRRVRLIQEMISILTPKYVDIEISTLRSNKSIFRTVEKTSSAIIASFHDLKGKKTSRELGHVISEAPERKSIFAIKIVREARSFDDNFRVLDLYNSFKSKSHLVAFCTGPLGIFSRVLCLFMGSPYTYASLPEEPLASGQLDIETMRDAVRLTQRGIA